MFHFPVHQKRDCSLQRRQIRDLFLSFLLAQPDFEASLIQMRTRVAAHAGSWYESSGSNLSRSLSNWLDAARQDPDLPTCGSNVVGVIAPHAGYSYSGPAAAYAYAAVDPSRFDTVVVLGPSHHVSISNRAGLTSAEALETPVGKLAVDSDINATLLSENEVQGSELFFVMDKNVDEDEHSIEMHLPYLRHIFGADAEPGGRVRVVPVMVGALDDKTERLLGEIFSRWLADRRSLVVVSSDFCHWGSRFRYTPFRDRGGDIWKNIERLDREGMDHVESCSRDSFTSYIGRTQNTICGRYPLAVLLSAIEAKSAEDLAVRFVRYEQSSKCKNRADSSVSYASAHVFVKES